MANVQPPAEDVMKSIPLTPSVIAKFTDFLVNPKKYDCDYKPLKECFVEGDHYEPQHLLYRRCGADEPDASLCIKDGANLTVAEIHTGDVDSANALCKEIARRFNEFPEELKQ